MNELSPVDIFISELQELLRAGQVIILDHYAENQTYQGIPIIGYYKDNRKFICLLPKIATDVVRKNSPSGLVHKGILERKGISRNIRYVLTSKSHAT